MKTEEYRTQYGQRKESRNRELELLRQTIIVYRQIVRKKLAEMDSAQALHDSAGYEKCLAEYTDAVKSEERFKCMFISVQREPICWCSKDAKEWFPCVTAFIGNDSIDLIALQERLIEAEPDDDLQKVFDEAIERDWEYAKTD